MLKSYTINAFALLLLAMLLGACVGTTQIEFDPAVETEQEAVSDEVEDVSPDELPEPEEEPPPEIKPYDTDIAGSAEQLYGGDPGSSTDPAYIKAAEANPMLKYTIIYFDFNKSEVKADAREILSHHAAFMEAHPEVRLRIEGHADQRGSGGYNLALGELRANAVRTILEAYGISGTRISVISYGEEQPAVDGNTEEAFRLNRRAELIYR